MRAAASEMATAQVEAAAAEEEMAEATAVATEAVGTAAAPAEWKGHNAQAARQFASDGWDQTAGEPPADGKMTASARVGRVDRVCPQVNLLTRRWKRRAGEEMCCCVRSRAALRAHVV